MVGQHCVIEAFVWMLYCLTGREAGVGGGIVHVCVLTWTFCDGFQLDGWCGTEDSERRVEEKNRLKEDLKTLIKQTKHAARRTADWDGLEDTETNLGLSVRDHQKRSFSNMD